MKVYLINPDYMLYRNPPLGLAYLASYIRKKAPHIKIKIMDQISYRKILKKVEKDKPEIIGISAVSENWFKVKNMGREIKNKLKDSKLVIGGVHVTTQPSCFKDSPFDYGVLGEGEIPFLELIKVIELKKEDKKNLKKIKGVIFRDNGKIINNGLPEQIQNLDDIPLPALDLLNMKYYTLPSFSAGSKRMFIMFTSRGCPYDCKFCSSSCFWGRKIRFFSAERVVNEIENLHKKYKFGKIEIGDDIFVINEQRLGKIIEGLRKKGLLGKIEFGCGGRANLFNDSVVKKLKELGVNMIAFGFESGSKRTLKWLKGDTVTVEMKDRKSTRLNSSH
jgi:radical SAM superfamily enzyme YgiQ (UPF0313 family)